MNECCICQKQLEGWQTFGPLRYPVCQAHYWEYGERLEEIDAMGNSHYDAKEKEIAFSELKRMSHLPTQELRRISELEKKISLWEDDLEDLKDEMREVRWKIEEALEEIKKAKRGQMVAQQAPTPAGE